MYFSDTIITNSWCTSFNEYYGYVKQRICRPHREIWKNPGKISIKLKKELKTMIMAYINFKSIKEHNKN